MIDCQDALSVRRQCALVGLDRSGLYYKPAGPGPEEIALCHRLDELYTARPFYGVRRMTEQLRREGQTINPKRVRRLLRELGLKAVYPKPRLSLPGAGARVFPYLLRGSLTGAALRFKMKPQPRLEANLNPASIGPEDGEHLKSLIKLSEP